MYNPIDVQHHGYETVMVYIKYKKDPKFFFFPFLCHSEYSWNWTFQEIFVNGIFPKIIETLVAIKSNHILQGWLKAPK